MLQMTRRTALAATAALLLAACGEKPMEPALGDPAAARYAGALNIDMAKMTKTATGLYYRDLVEGTGERADTGSTVSVNYTGWLTNGSKFDSSEGSPIEFPLGRHAVVDGWDQGLAGMKAGGKRQLVIPSALGYGDDGRPPQIPGKAIMVFTVEMMGVKK